MRFPEEFLNELKSRVRLSDVVGKKVQLKKRGKDWVGLSPFSSEKTPSFYVHDDRGFYKCFSTQKSGDAITFLVETERLTFSEAVEKLARDYGLELPKQSAAEQQQYRRRTTLIEWVEKACAFFEMQLLRPGGREAREYLQKRGFDEHAWAREVVAEFARHLDDELDLMREAANASQLRRNFRNSPLLAVPEIHWQYCSTEVMVMERMHGTPVSAVAEMHAQGIDIPKLARAGVEIFFTQVFRDGFFHADMHPGNILVAANGQYVALDFGIMGTLTEVDKHYLARNFIAFFRRDYRRVAEVHVESGWAPPGTRVDEFETAIRAVCEPIFDKPLKDISFGKVLLRLFQTSRRFNIEIQPQLVLLQKTLLNVEGLGRDLDPNLDLWSTAKPFLERWMSEQVGWRGLVRRVGEELPFWSELLPQLPRLAQQFLARDPEAALRAHVAALLAQQRRNTWLLGIAIGLLAALLALQLLS